MCGVYFYFDRQSLVDRNFPGLNFLRHRGRDSEILEIDSNESQCIYGFTRLAIRSKSDGMQPFKYKGNVSMINGELFNESKIREKLSSDGLLDELPAGDMQLLGLYIMEFGTNSLKECRGQFAGVVHLVAQKKLILFRDFLGEKPLFYRIDFNNCIEVCSEHRFNESNSFDNQSLKVNMSSKEVRQGFYDSSSESQIKEVRPGHCVVIDLCSFTEVDESFQEIERRIVSSDRYSFSARINEFENALINAVETQLIADDKVDVLLSGGVDSSLITYYARKLSKKKTVTYTVGFDRKHYDESVKAKDVSNFLGIENEAFYFNESNLADLIPEILKSMDVPILDPACIPLYALLKNISVKSNCVLTGDGGDELTQGYELFKYLAYIKGINMLPRFARLGLSNFLKQIKIFDFDDYKGIQFKIDRFSDVLLDDSTNFTAALSPFAGTSLYKTLIQSRPRENKAKEKISNRNLELYYLKKILPNVYLRKSDRMGMANGIELRAPFLDYEVVKASMNFSEEELRKMGRKGPISYLALQHLPEAIANQDKHGFSFRFNSIKKHLRTPLWNLHEVGFSKEVCNDLWNNSSNNYNYSLASWALYVLNHFKNENKLEFK